MMSCVIASVSTPAYTYSNMMQEFKNYEKCSKILAATHYTHSSTLRTIQEPLGVTPLLGDAARATDLRDLFVKFP